MIRRLPAVLVLMAPLAAAAQTPRASPGHPGWTEAGNDCFVWNQNPAAGETATWSGGCKDRRATGKGTLVWRDGTAEQRYEGGMLDGRMNGHGIYTFANGDRYDGEFKNDDFDGVGTLVEGQSRYEGQWKAGKKNGRGILVTPDGTRIEGEFKDDAVDGFALFVLRDGRRFEGMIHDHVPNGPGTLIEPGGATYAGNWVNGCFKDGNRKAAFAVDPATCP
jgi:hypothetical protein